MPADKYGKSLYKAGTVKSEKAAIANRDPARKAAAIKIMAREGTTRGPEMVKPVKAPQVIRTTVSMKSSPMTTKRK
jgi:hypothetical protein